MLVKTLENGRNLYVYLLLGGRARLGIGDESGMDNVW
jgi:hypothetical protein